MRQRQNEQTTDLATIESELAALKHSMQPQIDLKNKITEQEKRISELERQLYNEKTALGVARGQILQQSRVADGLKIELQQMVTAKDKAEATI
jgi:predicted RNase H-like nuclease (RuvC/YqgF family)